MRAYPAGQPETETSRRRWRRLIVLVGLLERCLEANARLDMRHQAHCDPRGAKVRSEHARTVEQSLNRLYARMLAEANRLSCERLRIDLMERQLRDAADVGIVTEAA